MKPLADEKIKNLFCALTIVWGVVLLLTEGWLIFQLWERLNSGAPPFPPGLGGDAGPLRPLH